MAADIKFSVIIPIYNVENYLRRCLDSLLSQTFTDYEVLLIDDGSTDASGNICDEYVEKDRRVKVVHQKNQGVSVARQRGLDMVQGKYVAFVDPDDFVQPNYLSAMINFAESDDADLVWCDYTELHHDGEMLHSCNQNILTREELLENILEGKFSAVLWNKLYKASIIKRYGIRFDENLKTAEDILFVSKYICQVKRMKYVSQSLYNYNMVNSNSAINKFDVLRFKTDYAVMLKQLIQTLRAEGMYQQLFPSILRCMFYCKDIYAFDSRYRDFEKYRNMFPEVDAHLNSLRNVSFFRKCALECIRKKWNMLAYICLALNKIARI